MTASSVGVRGFWDLIGNTSSVMSIIGFMQGLSNSGPPPGLSLEELREHQEEMLRLLREGQAAILEGIGGVSGEIGGVSDQVDEIEELLKRLDETSGVEHEEIKGQLNALLAQQQKNTAAILSSIGVVSQQVSGMWADMNAWFSEALAQLDQMSKMLQALSEQLAQITALLQEVLGEISELQDRVEWNAIITMLADHQHRIQYSIETALDIHVTPAEGGRQDGLPALEVDPAELRAWALATVDLHNGLTFPLYAMHQVLMGETLLGKPLMEVYFRLLSHTDLTKMQRKTASRFFAHFVASQAQGFGVLDKARQYLGMPSVDYSELVTDRVDKQTAVCAKALHSVLGINEWRESEGGFMSNHYSLPDLSGTDRGTRIFTVENNSEVISEIYVGDTVEFRVGSTVPGTRVLEEGSSMRTTFIDGNSYSITDLLMKNGESLNWDSRRFLIDPAYAVVGFKFSTPDGVIRCEPLVAQFDLETGTTSWDGGNEGVWIAALPGGWTPADQGFSSDGPWSRFVALDYRERHSEIPYGMLRGVQISVTLIAGAHVQVNYGFASSSWEAATWLPMSPGTPDVSYDLPVTELPELPPLPELVIEDNVASGQAVTASTSQADHAPALVVNGQPDTWWSSTGGQQQWLQVDLGQIHDICSINLHLPRNWPTRWQTLSVAGSTDGVEYAPLATSATYRFARSADNRVKIGFEPAQVQYIKIEFTSNSAGDFAQLSELTAELTLPYGSNLALNQPVKVSSEGERHKGSARHTVEGQYANAWHSKGAALPQHWMVDLGDVAEITKINVGCLHEGEVTFSVHGSMDGVHTTKIISSATYSTEDPGVGDRIVSIIVPPGTTARYRYVQLYFNDVSWDSKAISLTEVEVFGFMCPDSGPGAQVGPGGDRSIVGSHTAGQ